MPRLKTLIATLTALLLVPGFFTPAQASNLAGLTPTFATPESVAGGFAVQITNWDPNFTWSATASDCAVATVQDGWLTVTGVLANQTVSARVFTNRAGYDEGSAVASGSAGDYLVPSFLSPENSSGWLQAAKADTQGRMFTIRDEALNGQVAVEVSSNQGKSWTTVKTWSTTSSTKSPDLETGLSGLVGAVWVAPGASAGTVVKAGISLDSGATWTDYVLSAQAAVTEPNISFTSSGTAVALWRQTDGGVEKVFSSHLISGQSTWSTPIIVSNAADSFYGIDMAKTSDGHVMAIWGRGQGISAAKFDKVSAQWSAPVEIAAQYNETASMRIDADESGRIWAVWFTGSPRHVGIASFDGTAWNSVGPATPFTGSYGSPAIVATSNEVVVAWTQSGASLGYRRYNLSSSTWGASSTIFTGGQPMQNLWLNQGSGSNLYLSFLKQSANSSYYLPFVATSSNGGSSWTTPVNVAPSSRNNYWPRTATDSTGAVFVFWQDQADYGGQQRQRPMSTTIASTVSSIDPRQFYQVAEINPGAGHASIYDMAVLNNKLYLIANSADTGFELFEYVNNNIDLVQDLNPGAGNGLYDTKFLAKTANALYFSGTDGYTGYEVYKFDGTSISLVSEINPAQTTPSDASGQLFQGSMPTNAILFNNKLFFSTSYPSSASYLIDLAAQTPAAIRLSSYFTSFTAGGFYASAVVGNKLYFEASGGVYETDGSTATPVLVPGTSGVNVFSLGAFGNKLVLGASPTGNDQNVELMVWDPADPTTPASLVENINTYNTGGEKGSFPSLFATRCNELYFVASSGYAGVIDNRELWKWDGNSVTLAKDYWPGSTASDSGWPQSLSVIDNEIFTFAQTAATGFEPWIMRGNESSMIVDFKPGAAGSISGAPPVFEWNDQIYTSLWGPTGLELYAYGVQPQNHQIATFAMNYTITYDANGGTGTATQTAASGSVSLHSGAGFTKTGKVLLGWDASNTATTATYSTSGAFNLSANTTLYAVWGDQPSTSSPTESQPTIDLPGGTVTATSGGDLDLQGKNFGGVTSAEVGDKEASIKAKTDTSLKLGLPTLKPGVYSLTLTSNFGKLTIDGAVKITLGGMDLTADAKAQIRVWTKRNVSKTKVELIAKHVIAKGKIQFFHNGKEVTWIRATADNQERLANRSGSSYYRRLVSLEPGKNRFEILLDGKRIWRATYSGN